MVVCNICGFNLRKSKKMFWKFNEEHTEEIYSEKCCKCGQLLYGYSKKIK